MAHDVLCLYGMNVLGGIYLYLNYSCLSVRYGKSVETI